jgi:hypothetical protein
MKGGFELIALALLQVLDRSAHLLGRSGAHYLSCVSIDGNQAYLAHRPVARTGQKDRYDPEFLFTHQAVGPSS